eukprot:1158392-Pelagomonas_calceolata.AAC.14
MQWAHRHAKYAHVFVECARAHSFCLKNHIRCYAKPKRACLPVQIHIRSLRRQAWPCTVVVIRDENAL